MVGPGSICEYELLLVSCDMKKILERVTAERWKLKK